MCVLDILPTVQSTGHDCERAHYPPWTSSKFVLRWNLSTVRKTIFFSFPFSQSLHHLSASYVGLRLYFIPLSLLVILFRLHTETTSFHQQSFSLSHLEMNRLSFSVSFSAPKIATMAFSVFFRPKKQRHVRYFFLAMLCISAAYDVGRWLGGWLSRSCIVSKRLKILP